jgi:hypothetical protein
LHAFFVSPLHAKFTAALIFLVFMTLILSALNIYVVYHVDKFLG